MGIMPRHVRLEVGSFGGEDKVGQGYLDKRVMLVYSGEFKSLDGPVIIKDEDIDQLASIHNSFLSKLSRLATGDIPLKHAPPIQLDHSTSARDTVGRLVGDLEVGEFDDEGTKKKALFGTARILGDENIERVKDGRWTHVSMGADLESHKITELTITPFPAAANASLLSKNPTLTQGDNEMPAYKELKCKMEAFEKCKRHLMDKEKLSDEDAEKKLGELDDEAVRKMVAEYDAELARIADEEAKKKEAELKRMGALKDHKTKLIQLNIDLRGSSEKIRLAAKKSAISVRLGKLKAAGKITPAEVKKLSLDDMARASDEVLNAQLKSYEERQPVIDVGLYGTVKALTASQLQANLKRLSMEREELQTRLNMPSKRDEALKRLAQIEDEEREVNVHIDNVPQGSHPSEMEGFDMAWDECAKMIGEGKGAEAKERMKKYMGAIVGPRMTESMPVSDSTPEMSALAEDIKKMQTSFEEIVKLAAPVFGVTTEELG
jgi:hypothetical protein